MILLYFTDKSYDLFYYPFLLFFRNQNLGNCQSISTVRRDYIYFWEPWDDLNSFWNYVCLSMNVYMCEWTQHERVCVSFMYLSWNSKHTCQIPAVIAPFWIWFGLDQYCKTFVNLSGDISSTQFSDNNRKSLHGKRLGCLVLPVNSNEKKISL